MEQKLPKATIDDRLIQLDKCHRIKVLKWYMMPQSDGTYTCSGIEQTRGVFFYKKLRDVVLVYDSAKNLTHFGELQNQ